MALAGHLAAVHAAMPPALTLLEDPYEAWNQTASALRPTRDAILEAAIEALPEVGLPLTGGGGKK